MLETKYIASKMFNNRSLNINNRAIKRPNKTHPFGMSEIAVRKCRDGRSMLSGFYREALAREPRRRRRSGDLRFLRRVRRHRYRRSLKVCHSGTRERKEDDRLFCAAESLLALFMLLIPTLSYDASFENVGGTFSSEEGGTFS